ncbi:Homospermidine synthase 1 [Platanthera guangdongensis]|uniref:Homospermidine synthase 1 n=1 Tax=Platanthera guangdongensis TaxID=2320717 RepID=A0ABR2MNU0_9ASPA
MDEEAVNASPRKTGVIILGGGVPKHHICNANMLRNGADYAVFINTAQEFDCSDSGARLDEAVSWGNLNILPEMKQVHCDATIAFPLEHCIEIYGFYLRLLVNKSYCRIMQIYYTNCSSHFSIIGFHFFLCRMIPMYRSCTEISTQ